MSTSETLDESRVVRQGVNLILGLFVVYMLVYIALMALPGDAWIGVLFGVIELGVAWRVTPPAGARSLRWITGMFGAFMLAFSVVRLFVS